MTVTTDPTFSRIPEGDESTGHDAVNLALAYGIGLDSWQQDIIRGILRETPDGDWAVSQAGLVVARQSGKGSCLLALELAGLLLFGENILHTSHAVKTSSDAFRRLWAILDGHDDLRRLIKRHSQMIGAEYVELSTGARIAFTTRSASAGRGLAIDRLVVDEAEDLPAHEVAALAPTTFSRPRAQSLYFGTAPGPTHDSEAFLTMRRTAHEGLNPRLAWWEWSAEWGSDDADEALWVRVNPAVASGRVPIQAIRDDKAVLPLDAFRAERLSMFVPRGGAGQVFTEATWAGLLGEDSQILECIAVGIDTPPSREESTACVAGRRPDGALHLEWYVTAEGVAWLPEWVRERLSSKVRAVVVDGRNAAGEVDWRAHGVRPTVVGTRDVAAAAGGLFDAVMGGTVRHAGQVELTRGVLGARQRPLLGGQSFGWDRKGPGSSVLIAASLALWGVEAATVERPKRKVPGEVGERRAVVM